MRTEVDAADRAEATLARGAWQEALDLLRATGSERALSPRELELLAQAAYGAGDLEAAIGAWERVHRLHLDADAPTAAASAAVTVALYLMMDTGLMAPVRGWTARAARLLQDGPETPVHAWLAMVRAYERLMSGDLADAGRQARQAVDIGTRQATPAPVAVGRVATARLLILDGEVEDGLALLDEAAVATVSGDLDPLTVGIVYCELICAMQGLAQFDRAEQWTDAMERWRRDHAIGAMSGRCRVHRAEILRLRGSCEEAETEALHACEELRPWMRREYGWPLTELGTIRLRKGDLTGAEEAFLAAHERGWDPQPGLALVRLAQGDVACATEMVRDALEHPRRLPSKERPPSGGLVRAPLLDAQVEIALAAGDAATAQRAADELTGIAVTYRSRGLAAAAALARGRAAMTRGDAETAVVACHEAVGAWSDVGAPFETAVARVALAQAHGGRGGHDRVLLELRAARSTFERLGARGRAHAAALALEQAPTRDRGPQAAGAPAPAPEPDSVFRREGDTRTVGFADETVLLRDLKGMRYLARMLADPGREFHVFDLVAAEQATPATGPPPPEEGLHSSDGELGPLLDDRAVQAYKRRLADIEEDLEEANRNGDTDRAALAGADRDYLLAELSRSFGLGGRHRPTGSTSERARTSVTRALRYALARIDEHHPAAAAHFRHGLRTGTYCSYSPDPGSPVTWHV